MPTAWYAFRTRVYFLQPDGKSAQCTVNRIFYRRQTDQQLVPVFGGEADNTSCALPELRNAPIVYELTHDASGNQTFLADELHVSYA
jgi:hypothetical protein